MYKVMFARKDNMTLKKFDSKYDTLDQAQARALKVLENNYVSVDWEVIIVN